MIKVQNLLKFYTIGGQKLSAAQNVNFSVAKGEMVSIVGHSGSGKTTLLSLVGGLTKPDDGEVFINGQNIWAMDDNSRSEFRNRKISFIYQFASLIPTLTALENVILPTAFGSDRSDFSQKALQLLDKVGMADKVRYYPSQLSGGQQRRVAIARALINEPEIVLADEPTGDLDAVTEKEVMNLFMEVKQQRAVTFIIVTHDTAIASTADRQFSMVDGVLTTD
jgi:putative ABC transport system ATP-binding protein/lipoprotein-releasing system ATP-binding protein